jgi:hypothetical protein
LAEHTSNLAEHTSDLADHTFDLANHTSDLADHTSDLTDNTSDLTDHTNLPDKTSNLTDKAYELAVDNVKLGEDGHVRAVNIRYTNPGKEPGERSPPKITTRPIHKIAVIVQVDYVFEDDLGSKANGVGLPGLAQAGAIDHEEGAAAPPDQDTKQPRPAGETPQRAEAAQLPKETKEEAANKPDPVAATKKSPGRPRKEVKPGADPADIQLANGPEANERPRRQAAIRTEENMRGGKKKNTEAWPLLQARANHRWQQRRN